jgi:hypothetical protein
MNSWESGSIKIEAKDKKIFSLVILEVKARKYFHWFPFKIRKYSYWLLVRL